MGWLESNYEIYHQMVFNLFKTIYFHFKLINLSCHRYILMLDSGWLLVGFQSITDREIYSFVLETILY